MGKNSFREAIRKKIKHLELPIVGDWGILCITLGKEGKNAGERIYVAHGEKPRFTPRKALLKNI